MATATLHNNGAAASGDIQIVDYQMDPCEKITWSCVASGIMLLAISIILLALVILLSPLVLPAWDIVFEKYYNLIWTAPIAVVACATAAPLLAIYPFWLGAEMGWYAFKKLHYVTYDKPYSGEPPFFAR